MPVPAYLPCIGMGDSNRIEEDEMIVGYFIQGYTNLEIVAFINDVHGQNISLSTLKRRLRNMGLKRRCETVPTDEELREVLLKELVGSGCFVGYRKMWSRLRRSGIIVKRSRVMMLLRELDPEGVDCRKNKRLRRRAYHTKGPNFIWHIDGHDKLKPFGFSIHACIDGYSRRLIWLEVCPSNKNPEVIGRFYLDAVKQLGGVPRKMRSDDGTESSIVEALHLFLRSTHDDEDVGFGCFSIGRSTSNQRIEAYWSHLIKESPGWWRNFFTGLRDLNLFIDSDPVHVECIRFCFMDLLRKELDTIAELWNQHIISSSKYGNSSSPRGHPDCMFFLPHLYDTHDYMQDITAVLVDEFYDVTITQNDYSQEFEEFVNTVMEEEMLCRPRDVKEGLELYTRLVTEIEALKQT